jgi:hypothetical protein
VRVRCYQFHCKHGEFVMVHLVFFSLQAIRTGWVHPNLNLENPEKTVVSLFTDAESNAVLVLFLLLLKRKMCSETNGANNFAELHRS